MNDGQSTMHREPDPGPLKVHLLTRAGRLCALGSKRLELVLMRLALSVNPLEIAKKGIFGRTLHFVPSEVRSNALILVERPLRCKFAQSGLNALGDHRTSLTTRRIIRQTGLICCRQSSSS